MFFFSVWRVCCVLFCCWLVLFFGIVLVLVLVCGGEFLGFGDVCLVLLGVRFGCRVFCSCFFNWWW